MSIRDSGPLRGAVMAKACLAVIALAGCTVAGEEADAEDGSPEHLGSIVEAATTPPVLKTTPAFPVGVGFGPASTATEYANLKAAGFNVTTRPAEAYLSPYTSSAMLATLDIAASNGVSAAVFDGALWGAIDTGTSVTTAAATFDSTYRAKSAAKYWWIKDEPGKNVFANIQTAAAKLKSLSATKRRFVNLYPASAPCYALAGIAQGTPCSYAYKTYVHDFLLAATDVDLITFDHYPFLSNGTTEANEWFATLEAIRQEAHTHTREYGAVIQGSAYTGHRNPTAREMMWQAMSALAYGARMIDWFSWTSSSSPTETVTGFGASSADRTEVKSVTSELQAFGKYLTQATSEAVWHADTGRPPGTAGRPAGDPVTLDNVPLYVGRFTVPSQAGKLILIGNRSTTARVESLSTTSICPTTSTGHVWVNLGSTAWSLVDSNASAGQCVGFDLSLGAAEAQLFYIN